jgi:DNA-binding protein HU-beta
VNRSQLVTALSERIDTTRREADALLTSIVDLITATVAAGEDVAISGFAKFRRVDRPARMGRNPATGETIRIKAKRSAKITPLKSFKDAVLTGKIPAAKKAPARKTTARKAPAKKAPAKRGAAKKTTARKAPARKAPAKKATARKAPAKKTTARKTTAKKATRRR